MNGWDAVRAEWTKARTVAATGWLLLATAGLGIGLSALVSAVVPPGAGQDPAGLALSGVRLAQAFVAIGAARTVTGEYRSGMIHTTLTAIPPRGTVIAAKTAVNATLALAVGAGTVGGCLLVARADPTPRAALGSVLYLVLISVLATGVALAVRDSAAATGIVLGLLYLFPLAAQLAGDATWRRHIEQLGPSTAGLAIQATTDLDTLPIQPWAGLGVLAAWSAAAILTGGLLLRLRDP